MAALSVMTVFVLASSALAKPTVTEGADSDIWTGRGDSDRGETSYSEALLLELSKPYDNSAALLDNCCAAAETRKTPEAGRIVLEGGIYTFNAFSFAGTRKNNDASGRLHFDVGEAIFAGDIPVMPDGHRDENTFSAIGIYASPVSVAIVPAPGAVALGSIGALLVNWLRRRRSF
jgi:hypothetical protein